MTALEQQTGTYWRQSQTLRGLREGYPIAADAILATVVAMVPGTRLAELAKRNSESRYAETKHAKVIDAFSLPPRPLARTGGGIDDLI